MSELLAALGMATIRNHEELRGKSLVVKVKVRKSDEYGDSNDVQNYYAATAETAPAGALSRLRRRRLLRQATSSATCCRGCRWRAVGSAELGFLWAASEER